MTFSTVALPAAGNASISATFCIYPCRSPADARGKSVSIRTSTGPIAVPLIGVDLRGDLNRKPVLTRLYVLQNGVGQWIPPNQLAQNYDVRSLRPNVKRDRLHLERIVSLWDGGAVRVPEIKLFKLTEAAAAHELSEGRHLRGKLVFMVR